MVKQESHLGVRANRAFAETNKRNLAMLLEALRFTRGQVLDTVELVFSDTKEWPTVRSRLLRAMGERGLEAKVIEIMTEVGGVE